MGTSGLITILGSGALFTVILGIYDRVRNRKFEARKQGTTIKLDEATYAEITARSEQSNQTGLMAVGSFWQGQFAELEKRFASERLWRIRAQRKMREHRQWDALVARKMAECNMAVPEPPSLDPDEDSGPMRELTESGDSDPKG